MNRELLKTDGFLSSRFKHSQHEDAFFRVAIPLLNLGQEAILQK